MKKLLLSLVALLATVGAWAQSEPVLADGVYTIQADEDVTDLHSCRFSTAAGADPGNIQAGRQVVVILTQFRYRFAIDTDAQSLVCRSGYFHRTGIFFENFVANELIAKEHKLFYWRGKSSAELEFIIESDNKLYPIDVKKGRGTLNSLEKFSNHNKFEYANKEYSFEQVMLLGVQ